MSRSSSRGWSFWNPGYVDEYGSKPHDTNPRLFFSLQSARNALTMWLQGQWVNTQSSGSYFEPPEDTGPAPEEPPIKRKREDMEIVPMILLEGQGGGT